jgi:hypothetical protein
MCAARAMFDCSLRSRGSRFGAASFLSHSQTKSVSARSFRPGQRRAILAPVESAAVVVARRGKAPPLTPPPCGGARFADARSAMERSAD